MYLERIYSYRFSNADLEEKQKVWKILCTDFFQHYVKSDDVIVDLGAGSCEFINHIRGSVRYAVDIREELIRYADENVNPVIIDSKNMVCFEDEDVDFVFASNFFEHMQTKDEVVETLTEVHRILKKGGTLMILQPNVRYLYREYWDYFDHHIALSDRSMVEALLSVRFAIRELRPKFLPYTFKSRLPTHPWLVKVYLKISLLQSLFGKQMLIVAEKT